MPLIDRITTLTKILTRTAPRSSLLHGMNIYLPYGQLSDTASKLVLGDQDEYSEKSHLTHNSPRYLECLA